MLASGTKPGSRIGLSFDDRLPFLGIELVDKPGCFSYTAQVLAGEKGRWAGVGIR